MFLRFLTDSFSPDHIQSLWRFTTPGRNLRISLHVIRRGRIPVWWEFTPGLDPSERQWCVLGSLVRPSLRWEERWRYLQREAGHQWSGVRLGWWRGRTPVQPRWAPSAPHYPLSGGSRIHWIWSVASSLRGFGAEMSSRTRVSPCFHVRHLGKWGTPVFPWKQTWKRHPKNPVFSVVWKQRENSHVPLNPLQQLEPTVICTSRTSSWFAVSDRRC